MSFIRQCDGLWTVGEHAEFECFKEIPVTARQGYNFGKIRKKWKLVM